MFNRHFDLYFYSPPPLKAIRKRSFKLGLMRAYENNDAVRDLITSLMTLQYLPSHRIARAVNVSTKFCVFIVFLFTSNLNLLLLNYGNWNCVFQDVRIMVVSALTLELASLVCLRTSDAIGSAPSVCSCFRSTALCIEQQTE